MSDVELDNIDLEIINLIKDDARLSVRDISRAIKKAPSTVLNRLRKLKKLGVIKGYVTLIDYSKLNYQVNAITLLQVEGTHIEDVEKSLSAEPNVRAIYDVTGEYDIIILTTFKNVGDLDRFIKRLLKMPYVKRSVTNIAFRIVKESPNLREPLTY
ncbi:MAG: Lrp/AsnC family transcriptional regulator [Sulfolobales archaeon]|nr:Lrp/AsnC family transcriptional regulator [Sulfolobales archaeon]